MSYEKLLIQSAYRTGYNVEKALNEYTQLEIKYSKNPFKIDDTIRQKALEEMQNKMLKEYRK